MVEEPELLGGSAWRHLPWLSEKSVSGSLLSRRGGHSTPRAPIPATEDSLVL